MNKDAENTSGISDSDITLAMEEMSGYVDITLEDFREIYRHAYQHAHEKLCRGKVEKNAVPVPPCTAQERRSRRSVGTAGFRAVLKDYFLKMRGLEHSPPRVGLIEIGWSWAGAFVGIFLVAFCNCLMLDRADMVLLIGSFGASAVLLYGAIKSPLAQPRNLIGGHVVSAVIGVASYQCFASSPLLAAALAVATAIAVMHAAKMLHPPGGATALIAVIGGDQIHALGYLYALVPAGTGAVLMLAVALVVNNIPKSRRYPEYWW